MEYYICKACKWIYDPSKGDKTQNIPENTDFEDLPENWLCPECDAPKKVFIPYEF